MKKIVIGSTYKDAKRLVKINPGRKDDTLFIATEWSAHVAFEEEKVQFRFVEDYLNPGDFMEITKKAFEVSKAWHKDDSIEKYVRFCGISVGISVEHQLYYYLNVIMKTLHILENIVASERPDEIIAVEKSNPPLRNMLISQNEYPYERMLMFVTKHNNIKVCWIKESITDVILHLRDRYFTRLKIPACFKPTFTKGVWLPKIFYALFASLLPRLLFIRYLISRRFSKSKRFEKVIFLVPEPSIPKIYQPVLEKLSNKNNLLTVVMVQKKEIFNPLRPPLRNINYLFRDYFLSVKDRLKIYFFIIKTARTLFQSEAVNKYFTFMGYPLLRVERRRFTYLFKILFLDVAKTILSMQNFISREKVGLFVAINEIWEYFRSTIQTANKEKISSLLLLHGAPTKKHRYFVAIEPTLATQMATYGKLCDETLISQGVSAYRLTQTGNPQFDSYYLRNNGINEDGYAKFGLDVKKKTIVFAPTDVIKGKVARGITSFFKERQAMIRGIIEAINEIDNAQLVIKAKPGMESVDYLEYLTRRYSNKKIGVYKHCSLSELLRLSDVVITQHSTVALDAMILRKPVLVINFSDTPDRMDYVHKGAALGIYDTETIIPQLRLALWNRDIVNRLNERATIFLKEYTGLQDGKAAYRVVCLINDMIKNRKKYRHIIDESDY